jgi:hypothetical protein
MIRAGFAGEAVLRGMTTASLQEFLKSAFAIGIGDAVAIFESLEKDSSFQETANGIEAAIKVDRGDDRFEGVGEKGGLVAATGFFFTPAEAEMFAESEATSGDFEGVGVDDAGTAFGKLAFAPLGEIGEEIFAGQEFENGVAEKFETFIVLYGGAGEGNFFATGGAEFGNGGTVRQGAIQQSRLQELIAERNLELLVITANDHVHSRRAASPRAVPVVACRQARAENYFGALIWVVANFLASSTPFLQLVCKPLGIAAHLVKAATASSKWEVFSLQTPSRK